MGGQVQDGFALRTCQAGGDVDDLSPQGGAPGGGVGAAGQDPGGTQQVVGDRRAQDPGTVGAEMPRGHVGQWSVDEVGEHGFDDGVLAVGDVGLGGGRSVLVKNG